MGHVGGSLGATMVTFRAAAALPLLACLLPHAAMAAVRTMDIYRVTPRNYSTPINMNTGDAAGDTYFGLFKMGYPAACRNSTTGLCTPTTRIPGFNVYIKFVIELDDRFGPYAQCNPNKTGIYNCSRWFGDGGCWFNSTAHPEWKDEFASLCRQDECECPALLDRAVGRETILESTGPVVTPPAQWPKQCKAHFEPIGNVTISAGNATKRIRTLRWRTLAECCAACSAAQPPHVHETKSCDLYTYRSDSRTCTLFHTVNSSLSPVQQPHPHASSASHKGTQTPAIKAWYDGFDYLHKALMPGNWYSTRDLGMCKETEQVGVDCWWRLVKTERIVNSTCVDERMIQSIIQRNQTCFDQCADPTDRNSDCWILCFFNVITGNNSTHTPGISRDDALLPFQNAFKDPSEGGCPSVPPCPEPCYPPCWAVEKGQPCSNSTGTEEVASVVFGGTDTVVV